MLKKLISLLLVLAMVVGMMTVGAVSVFATEEGGENVTEPEATEPEATEPEVTEPEVTEPEVTEPPAPHEHSCEHCEGAEWIAWDGTVAALQQGGHFYLTQETTMDTCYSVEQLENKAVDVTICLNGQTLNGSTRGRMFRLSGGASLTIVDCTAKTVDGVYTAGSIKPQFHNIKGVVLGMFSDVSGEPGSSFTMYDGIIDGGSNSNASVVSASNIGGGLIDVNSNSTLNLYGGVLKDYTSYYGGAIFLNSGLLTIDGATISGCNATRGRAMMIRSSGKAVLESGEILGGTSNHGLVALQGGGQLTMNGGKIADAAGNNAYGVHINGATSKFTMNGGTISGNNKYGVWVESGTFDMTAGKITDNIHGVWVDTGIFNLSGGEITGNTSGTEGTGLRINNNAGKVVMTGGKIYGNECTGASSSTGGVRNLGTFEMSGGEIYGNTTAESVGNASEILAADANAVVTISGTAAITKTAKYSVNCYKGAVTVSGGTFTGPLSVSENCTLSISGGMFDTDVESYTAEGYTQLLTGEVAEVCVEHALVDGYCTRCGDLDPEAITGTGENSMVWILSQGELIISGYGTMSDFESGAAPWSQYADQIVEVDIKERVTSIGAYAFENLTALQFVEIPVEILQIGEGAFAGSGLTEIVFKGSAPMFVGEAIFTGVTANASYPVNDTSWTEDVKLGYGGEITWAGVAHSHTCEECQEANWLPFTGVDTSVSNGTNLQSGHYYLTGDTTLPMSIDLRDGQDVTLCLNGFNLYGPAKTRMFRLSGGSKLTIVDCSAGFDYDNDNQVIGYHAGKIIPRYHGIKGVVCGIYEGTGSTFNLYNGIIDGGNNSNASVVNSDNIGGGLIDMNSAGIINLYGGVLKDYTSYYGGAIYVGGGKLTIDGATIENCNATRGRAIMIKGSTSEAVLESGEILGGSATHGLVALQSGAKFTMNGGKLGNTTGANANGVHVSGANSVFTMNGGEISGNEKYGVWVETGTFNMNGGMIFDNLHGVVLDSAAFNMTDGEIFDNTAVAEGAGVRMQTTDGVFNMSGGSICRNSCTGISSSCGGVRVLGQFNMTGGSISGNVGTTDNTSQLICSDDAAVISISGTAQISNTGADEELNEVEVSKYSINCYKGAVTVSGGSYTGPVSVAKTCTLSITGGYFDSDVKAWVAEGYQQYLDGSVNTICTEHEIVDGYCTICGALDPSIPQGTCGENLTWVLVGGVLTISGTGDMEDYDYGTSPWYDYVADITSVVIEEGATSIGAMAFYGCANLTEVSISESVVAIGKYAFYDCASLAVVSIPANVTEIKEGTFWNCGLTSVTIPASIVKIGRWAFYDCKQLTQIEFLGDAPTFVGEEVFANVTANATIPENNETWTEEIKQSYGGTITWPAVHEHSYMYECDAYCKECGELTNPDAAHNITHVPAKAGTDCQTWDGNIEYWTCSYCNGCWDNENATGMPLTMMSIKVPGDHKYENGVCSVCGEADPDYVEPIVKFDFSGSTMTLGNELVLNFVYNKALLTGTDNYAKVTIAREDGDYTYEIPQGEWTAFNAALNQIPVKVFAKEMTDEVTVVICNAAGQEVSNPRTGSVVAYCNNLFEKSTVQKDKAMAVDMLNYGAAAQIQFNYREETLANAGLTDELKALATVVTDMQDASVKGPGCAGNTLTLEDKILLNFVYQNATIDKAAYATVSYVDHYDQAVSYNIEAADFLTFNSSMKMIQINTLVVADCRTMVSVELFDAEGNSLGVSKNSVESYTARSGQELFKAILAFGDSAYAKFH